MSPRKTPTPNEIASRLLSPKRAPPRIPKAPRLDNSPISSPRRRVQSRQMSPQVAPPLHALDGLLPADKLKLMCPVQELNRSFNTSSPHVTQFLRSPSAKLGISIVKKGRVRNVVLPPLPALDSDNQQSQMPSSPQHRVQAIPDMKIGNELI